jgi:RNA polymerase sigma factor for flagellar operon FliA
LNLADPLPWTDKARELDSPERARFLESHVDLVRYLALRMATRLPASVDVDDLISDGILGLLDAVEKFDPERSVRFRTYAESRIRGAILDGLRQKDWRPRSVRSLQRNLDETMCQLQSAQNGAITEEQIAAALGVDLQTYRSQLKDLAVGPLLSLDDIPFGGEPAAGEEGGPHAHIERRDLIEALTEEITRLPERERRVLELYYDQGLNMKEVGAVLGVTESRVCQLHSQAAARLRSALRARMTARPVLAGASRGDRHGR